MKSITWYHSIKCIFAFGLDLLWQQRAYSCCAIHIYSPPSFPITVAIAYACGSRIKRKKFHVTFSKYFRLSFRYIYLNVVKEINFIHLWDSLLQVCSPKTKQADSSALASISIYLLFASTTMALKGKKKASAKILPSSSFKQTGKKKFLFFPVHSFGVQPNTRRTKTQGEYRERKKTVM